MRTSLPRVARAACLFALLGAGHATTTAAQSLADVAEESARLRQEARTTGQPSSRRYGDSDLQPTRDTTRPAGAGTRSTAPAVPRGSAPLTEARREDIVRAVMPGVVTIETGRATGSGFFVTPDTVLTNKHVIAGGGSTVRIRYSDGTMGTGSIAATASDADLALVRVEQPPAGHPVLPLGPARSVQVGEDVIAVGSALGLLQGTVTRGIVSAVRSVGGITLVQTDAAINPGNSGGPLVNRSGVVVGITTAKMNAAESLGFAIATDHATELLGGATSVAHRDAGAPDWGQDDLDTALNPSLKSDADAERERGVAQFDEVVRAFARQADYIDGEWSRYREACTAKSDYYPVVGGREWFALWRETGSTDASSVPQCRAWKKEIGELAGRVRVGMLEAQERARRSGVFPGSTRAVRTKYLMDWTGWDR